MVLWAIILDFQLTWLLCIAGYTIEVQLPQGAGGELPQVVEPLYGNEREWQSAGAEYVYDCFCCCLLSVDLLPRLGFEPVN